MARGLISNKLRLPAMLPLLFLVAGAGGFAQETTGNAPAPAAAPSPSSSADERPAKSGFQQMREELFGPLEQYNLKNSMTRLMDPSRKNGPLPQMSQPDPKAREQREKRDEWIFNDLNELNSPLSIGDSAKGSDGKTLSPMERYYEDLGKKPATGSNSLSQTLTDMWSTRLATGTNSFSSMSLAMPGLDSLVNAMAPDGKKSSDQSGNSSMDSPGSAAADLKAAQKRSTDDFRRLLGHDSGAPLSTELESPITPFSELLKSTGPASPVFATPAGASMVPSPMPGAFAPTPSALPTALPAFHPSVQASASPAFSPAISIRTISSTPAAAPKPPFLDPFKDNLPKRSF